MQSFYNLKTRNKFLLLISVPLIALIIVSGTLLANNYYTKQNMDTVQKLSGLNLHLGNLIHELQKERGMSAGFIASNGQKFQMDLPEQQDRTDDQLQSLKTYLDQNRFPQLSDDIEGIHDELDRLSSQREQIRQQRLNLKRTTQYYTSIISSMLDLSSRVPTVTDHPEVAVNLAAAVNLSRTKEAAGLERAVLNAILSQGEFSGGLHEKWIRLLTRQKNHRDEFLRLSSQSLSENYQGALSKQVQEQVENIRANLRQVRKKNTETFQFSPEEWWKASTQRIDKLRQAEENVYQSIENDVQTIRAGAFWNLIGNGSLVGISLLLTLVISYLVGGFLLSGIRKLTNRFVRMAQGDLDVETVDINSTCELGELGDRFDEMLSSLKKLRDQAEAIADLDLTHDSLDESIQGDLGEAFETMVDRLSEFIRKLNSMAEDLETVGNQVSDASNELNRASQSLAEGAEEASSSLQETSSSVEEMTSMVEQSSENAQDARTIAREASETAQDGQEQIHEMANIVEQINNDSEKIAETIDIIDDIAFQTNLLALNAAVEAANAGEHGSGFAVVADEVRELAQRSAQAAEEISELIDSSVDRTEKGVEEAKNSQEVLDEILENVDSVDKHIGDIASASQEQSSGIQQINQAVTELEEVVEQTSSNAEQTSSSSDELNAQAQNLSETVEQLNLLVNQFSFDGKKIPSAQTASGSQNNDDPEKPVPSEEPEQDFIPLESDQGDF